MTRTLTLLIKETLEFAKVKRFLNSKSRNSEQTKKGYSIALAHLQTFLINSHYKNYNIETVLIALEEKKINVYDLLEDFIDYLTDRVDEYNSNTKLSAKTISFYIAGVKSYLEYYDIDISAKKLRNKVTIPKVYRRTKEALNAKKIRTILNSCSNVRLKTFILILASSGARSLEVLSLRNSDIDFSVSPTKIHIVAENTKTKRDRDMYVSDEASKELKQLLESKYHDKFEYVKQKYPTHFIFAKWKTDKIDPHNVYGVLHHQFAELLKKVQLDKRRDGQGVQRRNLSFHIFRDYVKSTVAIHTNSDFSEWILAHSGSTYWNVDEEVRIEEYLKCEKYLTFLDYPTVEAVSQDFEGKLEERDQEIEKLRQTIKRINDNVTKLETKGLGIPNRSDIKKIVDMLKKRNSKTKKTD
jgi:integrase